MMEYMQMRGLVGGCLKSMSGGITIHQNHFDL